MSIIDDKLMAIHDQLKQGVKPQGESVRSFLGWFGWERRGIYIVQYIREALKRPGLGTFPDFEWQYIDGYVGFVLAPQGKEQQQTHQSTSTTDPMVRLGRLDSANRPPTSVKPDATLQQAITLMMTRDFSQVLVMTSDRK
jgi:CBS domain-containing protein